MHAAIIDGSPRFYPRLPKRLEHEVGETIFPATVTGWQYDQRLTERLAPTWQLDDGVLHIAYQHRQRPLKEVRETLLANLADHRWRIETGGVELPNGARILTDRESQAQLTSAYQSLSMPFVESIDWKAADGWVTVTEAELRPIAQAVAQHVQGCFKAERQVSEQIAAAESAEALYGIDIAGKFEEALRDIKNV